MPAIRTPDGVIGHIDDLFLDPAQQLLELLEREYYLKLCSAVAGVNPKERLETVLSFVSEFDAKVLRHRIGLVNNSIYRLEYIGNFNCDPAEDSTINRNRARSRGHDRLNRAVMHLKQYLDNNRQPE